MDSCQEPYFNDELDNSEKVPCVEARITTFADNHYVKLYYARSYNEESYEDISGADVRVVDDLGRTYTFEEKYAGYYQIARGDFIGETGVSYTLVIDLPDGVVIKSYPQEMPDTIGIEDVSYPVILKEEVVETDEGTYNTLNTWVYCYQITPRQPEEDRFYYRLKSDFYVHSTYTESIESEAQEKDESGDSMITYKVTKTNTYDCYEIYSDDELPIIGELNADIPLTAEERTVETQYLVKDYTYYTSNNFVEWIVMADVYSISEKAYQYYEALIEQLSASDRIFDPIPTQLSGNMYCSSDTNQKVLGLFEVSAKSRLYNSLYKYTGIGGESIESRFYPDTSVFTSGSTLIGTSYDSVISGISPIEE